MYGAVCITGSLYNSLNRLPGPFNVADGPQSWVGPESAERSDTAAPRKPVRCRFLGRPMKLDRVGAIGRAYEAETRSQGTAEDLQVAAGGAEKSDSPFPVEQTVREVGFRVVRVSARPGDRHISTTDTDWKIIVVFIKLSSLLLLLLLLFV